MRDDPRRGYWQLGQCSTCRSQYQFVPPDMPVRLDADERAVGLVAWWLNRGHPCPVCGSASLWRATQVSTNWHFFALAIVTVTLVFYYLQAGSENALFPPSQWALVAGGGLSVALVVHLLVAFRRSNQNPELGREDADRLVDEGCLRVVRDFGRRNRSPGRVARIFQAFLAGLAFVAIPFVVWPFFLKAANRWPTTPGLGGEIVSAGDTVRIDFPDPICSVEGHWVGTPTATVATPNDPTPKPVSVTTSSSPWYGSIRTKSTTGEWVRPWAEVKLPIEASGQDRVTVHMAMPVQYPKMVSGREYVIEDILLRENRDIVLAPAGAGVQFREAAMNSRLSAVGVFLLSVILTLSAYVRHRLHKPSPYLMGGQ